MLIYGWLSKLLPEGRLKNRVKDFAFGHLIFKLTAGCREYQLKDDVRARFHRLLLAHTSIANFELIGYEQHYSVRPGDTVVDAGAYLGLFTVYAAIKAGPAGRVISFEPDPYLVKLLRRNVRLNGLTNVTIINKGLWSHDDLLGFESRGNASSFDLDGTRAGQVTKKLPVAGLDSELGRLGVETVNLVKMDVEGAELEAVKGCTGLMQRCGAHFSIASYHVVNGEQTAKPLERWFAKHGYESITGYPKHLTTYARKKD